MAYSIEKHIEGYCLVRDSGNTITTGAPHMKSALYFKTKAEAEQMRDALDIDTMLEKSEWTDKHHELFNTIPAIVRDIAGDLFEIKWYGHEDYDGMCEEVMRMIGGIKFPDFKRAYDSLTDDHKNLIYYAYEA